MKDLSNIHMWVENIIKINNLFSIVIILFFKVFRDSEKRKIFIASAIKFIQEYNFDGLDLDWEYPGQRGGSPTDVNSFTLLIKELKTEFKKYDYLLTAAVAAAETSFKQSYDVPALSQ